MITSLTDLCAKLHESRDYYLSLGWNRDDCAIGLFDDTLKLASDTGAINFTQRKDGCITREMFGCPSKLIEFVTTDLAIEISIYNRYTLDTTGHATCKLPN